MAASVRTKHLVLLLVASFMLYAQADDSADPDVLVAQNTAYGQYLTDFKGRPLYLFARDAKNTSNCYDACADSWPPLLFSDKPNPVAGKGLDGKMIGSAKRRDGKAQITFAGMPLYYYAKDLKTGDFAGQGVGGNWFLVSPKGEAIKVAAQAQPVAQAQQPAQQPAAQAQQPAQPTAAQVAAIAQAKKDGEPLYGTYCAGCHGVQGVGGAGPKFNNAPAFLKDAKGVIDQVLGGGQQMPGFAPALNDKQAAALITFIRNSWGNALGLTTEEEVKARRR